MYSKEKMNKIPHARIVTSILLFNADNRWHFNEEGPGDFKSVLDGHLTGDVSFIENRHRYQTKHHILNSGLVYDSMQCALNCLI